MYKYVYAVGEFDQHVPATHVTENIKNGMKHWHFVIEVALIAGCICYSVQNVGNKLC